MGFKFQPIQKIKFPITNENDEPIKEYTLDVGSESFVRAMLDKGQKVVALAKELTESPDGYDNLAASIEDFVNFSLGEGEYDFLFKAFDKNIFAMIELSRAITTEGGKAMENRIKQTNSLYV